MPKPSDFDTLRGTSIAPSATDVERGLALPVPDESELVQAAKRRGYALDFTPRFDEQPKLLPEPDGLKSWAQQKGFGLDFEPRYEYRATARSAAPKIKPTGKAVQSDPELTTRLQNGPGLLFVGARTQNFARAETIRAIEAVGREWARRHPDGPRMRVGGIGNVYGGPLTTGRKNPDGTPRFHKSHDVGVDADIRLMRNDHREDDTDIDKPAYSRALTAELISLFQQQTELPINVIFFEDLQVPGVRKEAGHRDHFHVRFQMPR